MNKLFLRTLLEKNRYLNMFLLKIYYLCTVIKFESCKYKKNGK